MNDTLIFSVRVDNVEANSRITGGGRGEWRRIGKSIPGSTPLQDGVVSEEPVSGVMQRSRQICEDGREECLTAERLFPSRESFGPCSLRACSRGVLNSMKAGSVFAD